MERRIEFEKFFDPFLAADEQGDDLDNDLEYQFARNVFMGDNLKLSPFKGRYVFSNVVGFMPLGEHNLPSRRHKLWVGNTNWQLTNADVDAMDRLNGVESLQILSPHRFRVGVGWMFKDAEVLSNIRLNLCPPPAAAPAEKVSITDPIQEAARRLFKAWAIVKVNGRRDCVGGESREVVIAKLKTKGDYVVECCSWKDPSGS